MHRKRQSLALFVGGIGMAAALLGAPTAAAEENGGGGAANPLQSPCQGTPGTSGFVTSGSTEECVEPGNAQLSATPNDLGAVGGIIDSGAGFGMGY